MWEFLTPKEEKTMKTEPDPADIDLSNLGPLCSEFFQHLMF